MDSRGYVNAFAVAQAAELADVLDAAVFADAQEDDAINDPLDGEIHRSLVQRLVAQGDVLGQLPAPFLDFFQEGIIEFLSAAAAGGAGVAIKVAAKHGVLAECSDEEFPFLGILAIGDVLAAGDGGFVELLGLDAAVVDRQFLKIGQQRQRKLGAPGIPTKLVRRLPELFDVDERLFRLQKKLPVPANPETVIRRFVRSRHAHAVLVNHFAILLGVSRCVVDVPAQFAEHRIDEVNAELGFVVVLRLHLIELVIEAFDEAEDRVGTGRHLRRMITGSLSLVIRP